MSEDIVPCPVPQEWMDTGAPAEALAAYAEGMCPVHREPLRAETIEHGGKLCKPRVQIPAGWCGECRAHWHRVTDDAAAVLGATWTTRP